MTKVLRRSSPSAIRALIAFVVILAGGATASADGRSSTVTLDFQNGTISPGDPTINLNSQPSVVLEIVPSGKYRVVPTGLEKKFAEAAARLSSSATLGSTFKTEIEGLSLGSEAQIDRAGKVLTSIADSVQTNEQDRATANVASDLIARTVGERAVFNFDAAREDGIEHADDSWSWTVHLRKRSRDYPIDIFCDSCTGERKHMVAVIHVETAAYDLAWSAGLAINSLRDERYRLDPNPDDPKTSRLVRNGSNSYPYQLATAANFCLAKRGIDWLCPATVGVSTDVPVDKLTVLLGPAVRFRPLDIRNAFYLGVGVAYGSRKELNDDYAGRSTAPAGTTSASLLTDRRRFGGYVSLTFGFLGSADKFKGVFSGSGESKGEAQTKSP